VLACAMPAAELMTTARVVRNRLASVAKELAEAMAADA
jgi:hypothetical protein